MQKMQMRPPQAPRIAIAAACTLAEPSQASQNEATRTLGKALSMAMGETLPLALAVRTQTMHAAHNAMHMATHQYRMRLHRAL